MNKQYFDEIMQEAEVIKNDLAAAVELVIGHTSIAEQQTALYSLLIEKTRQSKTPFKDAKYMGDLLLVTDWDKAFKWP